MPRLSPAGIATVSAGPANGGPVRIRTLASTPRRPAASCSVATPVATRRRARSASDAIGELGDEPVGGLDVPVREARNLARRARPQRGRDLDVLLRRGEAV